MAGNHILIADDEKDVLDTLVRIVQTLAEGAVVYRAENGEQALDVYQQHKGDIGLVILDEQMPRMGGYETTKRIRTIDEYIPIVIQSGTANAEEARRHGATEFLPKPYGLEALTAVIERYLPGISSPAQSQS